MGVRFPRPATILTKRGENMVTLPKRFVATKYPGYFWDMQAKMLYSIKMTGVLKPLKYQKTLLTMTKGGFIQPLMHGKHLGGYNVSHQGRKRRLTDEYLYGLTYTDSVIPETNIRTRWVANREKITVQQNLDF